MSYSRTLNEWVVDLYRLATGRTPQLVKAVDKADDEELKKVIAALSIVVEFIENGGDSKDKL